MVETHSFASIFLFALDPNILLQLLLPISGLVATIIVVVLVLFQKRKETEKKETIKDAEQKAENSPGKAKPAWDLARITLESYFNKNLFQIDLIFYLSVGVMCIGFGIIIWGIAEAIKYQQPANVDAVASVTGQITNNPATLIAGVAGIVTEFIGATFLFIYRSTIQQALNYSKTLERINSVGMAMQILDTMPNNTKLDDLKSKTKANLVELLIKQSNNLSESDSVQNTEK